MRKCAFLLVVITGLGISVSFGQDADLLLNHDLYRWVDRIDIRGYTDTTIYTFSKPYGRQYISEVFNTMDTSGCNLKEIKTLARMNLLANDNYANKQESKGVLKYFFRNKRDLYHYDGKELKLYANPVFYGGAGGTMHTYTDDGSRENRLIYRNSRGIRLRGTAFGKVGFFTEVVENQAKYPPHIKNNFDTQDVLWGEGFVKTFDENGFDYFSAKGYLTYSPVKQLRIKLGKDRYFWGNGYQSLLLSDHATDHFFLNLNTRIWKLEYINHFARLTDYIRDKPDPIGIHPAKYAVFHNLNYHPTDWLTFGIFESVVYSSSSPLGSRGFELEYLNPIIFYRSVEQSLGSPDNSMLGINYKVNLLNHLQVYGQIMLDDFNWRNRNNGSGYWGNKYGYQAGVKYVDVANIPMLDMQLEYNRVRPFTYTHFNTSANYSHYGQALAHPLGANFHEMNLNIRYQVLPQLVAKAGIIHSRKGLDEAGENYGGDIFKSYLIRTQDYNNVVGQGTATQVTQLSGLLSYQILNLDAWAELEGYLRMEDDASSLSMMGNLRWNIPQKPAKF